MEKILDEKEKKILLVGIEELQSALMAIDKFITGEKTDVEIIKQKLEMNNTICKLKDLLKQENIEIIIKKKNV